MDSSIQPPKKRYNLRKRRGKKNHKINEDSDSESDSDYFPSDEEESEGEINEEFKLKEFQKMLGKMFPSKATEKRIKQLEKIDQYKQKRKAFNRLKKNNKKREPSKSS